MSLQVEKLEKNMAKLTIEVPAEKVEAALQNAYLKNRKQISVPGFRKGKVPRQMIEKMYGPSIFYDDAVNAMIQEAYPEATKECDLEIVSRPDVEVVQIEKGKPFIFTAEVAVKPEVTLGQYKGIEVEKADTTATDEEVAAEIDKEREANSRTITVEDRAVQDGDMTVIDFEGFVDGKAFEGGKGTDYPLTIGSGAFIPGFEEKLVGAEIGKEVEVDVTFPEEYHAKELAGKPAVFKCTVKEIKVKELPELDDDFAQDVSDFDTLEEYKADVRKKVEEKKAADAKAKKEDAVIEKIIEGATMEIPDAMVETQAERMVDEFAQRLQMQGLSMEQYMQFTGGNVQAMVEQSKPQALKRIQSRLVLDAVVAAENLTATDEEVDAELGRMAEQYKMETEKLKEMFAEEDLKSIRDDLAVQKAVELVTDAAVEK
ncbi:trigger factor [Laedolimicola ammoniilytica]|uniref:Trigger factor n=1 Tax=Laedolimicola ammoniilytica TaxID=2981771 RepID=A0ABT2S2B4_9FIRM|nr:trigger factor [Laedolimicola ammoniilytica]MCU6698547.1 trigger factor [Laedolimicola ammoniilytica]SCI90593.1 Trigger factor [uncultured Clostridium sp.]